MNFSFSFSSSFGNSKKDKRRLTAQEEYWLDRILRNHSSQIFTVIIMFFLLILGSVVFAVLNQDKLNSSSEFSLIQVNP